MKLAQDLLYDGGLIGWEFPSMFFMVESCILKFPFDFNIGT